jgi:hypothetical protein
LKIFSLSKKGEAVTVTGHGGPWGCETSRPPHFLDSRLTVGGETVSLINRPAALYDEEDSWYAFLLVTESSPGPVSIEESNKLVGYRTVLPFNIL